jgi:hypothetical protein
MRMTPLSQETVAPKIVGRTYNPKMRFDKNLAQAAEEALLQKLAPFNSCSG